MKCPNCYKEINDGSKFCRYCGTKIKTHSNQTKCPKCGSQNRKDAKFCDSCGTKININGTSKENSITTSTNSVSRTSSNYNNENLNSASNIENDTSSSNTLIIAILAILFTIIIGGVLVLSIDTSSTIAVDRANFSIPDGFTEINNYFNKDVKKNINGEIFYLYYAGFEEHSQEDRIYINVIDHKVRFIKDGDIKNIINNLDYNNNVKYKKETINGQSGYLIPKSSDAGYIMNVFEPVDIFVYINNGDMILVGVTDKSYFNEVIE